MDLTKILPEMENRDELIKAINAEIGKEYVPRTEFNAKNTELKDLQKQLGEITTNYDSLSKEKGTWQQQLDELNGKVSGYEIAALKAKVAHEAGIPYELAGRLAGDDEASLREDAKILAGMVAPQTPPPLKSTEPATTGTDKSSAYKELLGKINQDE